jgi:hypothetical protein
MGILLWMIIGAEVGYIFTTYGDSSDRLSGNIFQGVEIALLFGWSLAIFGWARGSIIFGLSIYNFLFILLGTSFVFLFIHREQTEKLLIQINKRLGFSTRLLETGPGLNIRKGLRSLLLSVQLPLWVRRLRFHR